MIVVDIFSLSSLATRIKWLLQWIYVVKFATCDMNVVYGRQLKVSLELKRRLTTSTAVHLLVSLTAIIKFGLEPMDFIFKNGRCLDVCKKTLRTRFSWALFIRETVPNTAIARVTMNDYLSPQHIFNLMMEHEGKQIVFIANTISSRASLFEVIWSIKLPQLGQEILGLCLYGLFHWYLDNVRVSFQDYF